MLLWQLICEGEMGEMSKEQQWAMMRHPVVMNDTTVLLVTVLTSTNTLDDIWAAEYVDHVKSDAFAAREFNRDQLALRMLAVLRDVSSRERSHA